MSSYSPPVSELLKLGRNDLDKDTKLDYAQFGIGPEHVPELIRLMRDEDQWVSKDVPEIYAYIHAWRALGQLRAEAAIEPLLDLLDEQDHAEWNDWVSEDVPDILGMIGPAALAPTVARLNQRQPGQESANEIATALTKIAVHHPELRTEVIGHLVRVLQTGLRPDPTLNGFVISDLMELKAVEALPAIEAAYGLDLVDESIVGSFADVKYDLGVGPMPTHSQSGGLFLPQSARNPKQRAESRAKQRKAQKKKKKKRK